MFKTIVYAAFGWLTFTGTMHFLVDVVSQYLRGKRVPGPETTLYYGLNSAFSLGQVAFGAIGLIVVWSAPSIFKEIPTLLLAAVAGIGWLAITILFMEYWEPRFSVAVYCLLVLAALFLRPR